MVATDISSGEKVVMTEGDLALAASASACFPGIFVPVERDGRLLVDGGLVENLPISPLQAWGVDRIVAVDAFLGMTFHRPTKMLTSSRTLWTSRWFIQRKKWRRRWTFSSPQIFRPSDPQS